MKDMFVREAKGGSESLDGKRLVQELGLTIIYTPKPHSSPRGYMQMRVAARSYGFGRLADTSYLKLRCPGVQINIREVTSHKTIVFRCSRLRTAKKQLKGNGNHYSVLPLPTDHRELNSVISAGYVANHRKAFAAHHQSPLKYCSPCGVRSRKGLGYGLAILNPSKLKYTVFLAPVQQQITRRTASRFVVKRFVGAVDPESTESRRTVTDLVAKGGRVKGQNNKEMISTKPDKSTEIEACARKVAGREFEIHLHTNPPLAAIYDSQASMFL
uniref:Transposase n=1 Tax=Ascaris lumbricoides TaxID=6252 RepID=A0A0M3HV70_ASCLU